MTSVYSPVMLYTTHVLDAFIQTVNALHKQPGNAFDFGISLGMSQIALSTMNCGIWTSLPANTSPELRLPRGSRYHRLSKTYQAAGLDRTIPFIKRRQSRPFLHRFALVDANLRQTYIGDTVLAAEMSS